VDKFNLLHLENKIKNRTIPFITGEEKINELINNLKSKEKSYEVSKICRWFKNRNNSWKY
jgi:hypothetical protein